MTDNLPPLPGHPEHGWVWTESEQRAISAYAAAAVAAAVPQWTPASTLPPTKRPLDFESVVVLAVAETDDGAYQITPARVVSMRKAEWREVRFDHQGMGRKIVVRCWRPMPEFPKQVPPAPEVPR